MPFQPVLDHFSSNPFLPLDPLDSLKQKLFNDVPLIIGHNRDEGAHLLTKLMHNRTMLSHFVKNWKTVGPVIIFNR